MVLKGKALVPMDAREFYIQIDKADDELKVLKKKGYTPKIFFGDVFIW